MSNWAAAAAPTSPSGEPPGGSTILTPGFNDPHVLGGDGGRTMIKGNSSGDSIHGGGDFGNFVGQGGSSGDFGQSVKQEDSGGNFRHPVEQEVSHSPAVGQGIPGGGFRHSVKQRRRLRPLRRAGGFPLSGRWAGEQRQRLQPRSRAEGQRRREAGKMDNSPFKALNGSERAATTQSSRGAGKLGSRTILPSRPPMEARGRQQGSQQAAGKLAGEHQIPDP